MKDLSNDVSTLEELVNEFIKEFDVVSSEEPEDDFTADDNEEEANV